MPSPGDNRSEPSNIHPTTNDMHGSPSSSNKKYFPVLLSLCLTSLVNALIMVSFFPYAGWMVVWLRPMITQETAGPSAGLLAAAFMVGRLVSAPLWGFLADTWGRKAVLQSSLVASSLLSVAFGTVTNFPLAVATRFGLGLVNALTGTTKTLASEVLPEAEKQVMGWVVGMRSWGFLVGPALGGYLAEPLQRWRGSSRTYWLEESSPWYEFLEDFPFVLPNLVIGILCILCAILVTCTLPETLEDPQSMFEFVARFWSRESEKDIAAADAQEETALLAGDHDTHETTSTSDSVWSRPNTRQHLKVQWFFSFGITVLDEAFPLFAISSVLRWDEATIGSVLSLAGLWFALLQYPVYSALVDRLDVYPSIEWGCLLGLLPVIGIPILLGIFGAPGSDGEDHSYTFMSLMPWSFLLATSKIFACACLTCLALATNKTVPTTLRAQTNAYVLVGSSAVKALAPIAGGFLVAGALRFSNPSTLIFGAIALWGVASAVYARTLSQSPCDDER